jgi:hypothetical protein
MNKPHLASQLIILLSVLTGCFLTCSAKPLGSAFIYQGEITDSNLPATGFYDFQFKLFDSPADGNQIGITDSYFDIFVDNNSFTAELDFVDANATEQSYNRVWGSGQTRWLEIGVRTASSLSVMSLTGKPYSILKPRQQIMPAPFALYALSAGTTQAAGPQGPKGEKGEKGEKGAGIIC